MEGALKWQQFLGGRRLYEVGGQGPYAKSDQKAVYLPYF